MPAVLLRHLITGTAPSASAEASYGAVLFADISGFTALSERLASKGADGVEELTQILNAYFGKLIEVIVENGGDVVKFAGDALLAFWPVQAQHELTGVTRAAANCGLQVQAAMTTFAAAAGQRLSLRAGVGAGPLSAVSIGGVYQRWEFVVVGPPVVEATMAAGVGETGWVVLGQQAWNLLQDSATGTALTPEFTRLDAVSGTRPPIPLAVPTVSPEAVPNLLGFIPAAIHRRLAAGQSGWLAEIRRLTVLFVNLPDLTFRTTLAKSQAVMVALQEALYHYEGSVNKLSTDEKGVTFVAALGLPPLAHEDDPLRGTLAALAIHAKLTELGWASSVGVTSGRVFCGVIGSDVRCEFTIIGDLVNLSARLMQAAKGGILCDERTYKFAQDRFEWNVLPPIPLKGKAHPTPVFRPLRVAQDVVDLKRSQQMVGRSAEQRQLEEITQKTLEDCASAVVLIEGEAGIGKSTLVANVLRIAHKLELTTWLGAALAIERSTPYFAWRSIFRQLFDLHASEPTEEQCLQVLQLLEFDPELESRAALLNGVLSLDFPDSPLTAEMTGEVRLSNTNALLIRLLQRETEAAPRQLILEDCHWLDSASWALLRQASQQVPALLIVIVTRPLLEPLPRDFVPIAAAGTTHRLPLGPMSAEESLALVKRRLGVTDVPESMAELLRAKAQGNPFFIEELAYSLRDTGKIRIQNGRCVVASEADLRTLPFPDNVQAVVTSRIDRLAPQEQLTLKVASVIGRTFTRNLLHDVSPIEDDRPHLERHLDTLTSQSLTMLDTPAPDLAYSFKHVITQEVSYQMMPPAQRKKLHQIVAEWYERHHQADLSPYFPLLAKHWSNTDRVAKAIDYLEKSGESAMRDCAPEEAVTFFTQAISLDEATGSKADLFRRACWQRQLAEAHYNLSDLGTALRHFTIALNLLGYPSPRTGTGFVAASLWEFTKQRVHRAFPRWFFGRGKNQATQRIEAARAYERLVQIYYLNNAKVPSIHAAFRALNLSETVGECPELARNYAHAAVFCGLLFMHKSARAYARRSREMALRVRQQSCSAYVEFIRGVYWVTVGAWEEAEDNLREAMTITARIGERRRWYESAFTLANALSRKGDYRASAELSEQIRQVGTLQMVPQVQVWGLSWRLACLLALEADAAVWLPLETALASCLQAHPTIPLADQILGYGVLAVTQWRRGEKALAQQTCEQAEAIISRTNQISHYLPPAYRGLAEVYLGLWTDNPAMAPEMDRRMSHLCTVLSQFSLMYPIGKPTSHLVRGRYQWQKGHHAKALRSWRKSLAAAERYRMPYEQAQAHAELARRLPPDDPTADVHRRRARELFAQIGAAADLEFRDPNATRFDAGFQHNRPSMPNG
ncbi:adenylate/guanylate cyclase domain-containing protein [Limnoglobus roseus]|uniref:adenylate/guanylate cyclase domain-containing protein n=1 Tax=Limnoglobus roseus TaxID=2598579 RepID=UPI00143E06F8|nr:adenylate/guanylate cyclase domain-containing protein [Limnoglobus roseus]